MMNTEDAQDVNQPVDTLDANSSQEADEGALPHWALNATAVLSMCWGLLGQPNLPDRNFSLALAFSFMGLTLAWIGRDGPGRIAAPLRRLAGHWPGAAYRIGFALAALATLLAVWALASSFLQYRGESWQLQASRGARLLAARPGSVLGFCLACVGISLALIQARVWHLASHALTFVAASATLFIACGHVYAWLVGPEFPVELASSLPATLTTMALAVAAFRAASGRALPPMGLPMRVLASVVLVLAMLMSWRAWDRAQLAADQISRETFLHHTALLESELQRELANFERVLRDSAALVTITPELNREDWRAYVHELAVSQTLPGVQGIAFAYRVPRDQHDAFVARMRAQNLPGEPAYRIWPLPDLKASKDKQAPATTADFVPVSFIEPQDERNRRAHGFNIGGEPVRRQALDCATATRQPCATGKVKLVQETHEAVQPGFLVFMPVFERQAARAEPPKGFVYMPFRMYDLMDEVRRSARAETAVEIHDGPQTGEASLLYRSPEMRRARVLYEDQREVLAFGRRWILVFQSLPAFETSAFASRPSSVRYGLGMIALLSFGFVCVMVIERSTALRRSNEIADELRHLNTQLQAETKAHSRALREKETLLREVYHRVKNNLQVIQSLLSLQSRALPEGPPREVVSDLVQRIRAMSIVHEKLYQSGDLAAVPLASYVQDLITQLGDANAAGRRGITLNADVAPLQATLDSAVPLGLLLNELISNSLKHAFPESGGSIHISLQPKPEGGAELVVSDDGVGLPPDFTPGKSRSMGLKLAMSLAGQLNGELHFGPGEPRGTTVRAHLGAL